jgi:hypothetical protein
VPLKRVPWLVVFLAALLAAAFIFLREPPERPLPLEKMAREIPEPPLPAIPPVLVKLPPIPDKLPLPDLTLVTPSGRAFAIEHGKTIDFSTGLPLVKESDKDKAALDRALKEIEAATKGVTFESPKEPAPKK